MQIASLQLVYLCLIVDCIASMDPITIKEYAAMETLNIYYYIHSSVQSAIFQSNTIKTLGCFIKRCEKIPSYLFFRVRMSFTFISCNIASMFLFSFNYCFSIMTIICDKTIIFLKKTVFVERLRNLLEALQAICFFKAVACLWPDGTA